MRVSLLCWSHTKNGWPRGLGCVAPFSMLFTWFTFFTNPEYLEVPMVHKANSRKHLLQCLSRTGDCLKTPQTGSQCYVCVCMYIYIYTFCTLPPTTYLESFWIFDLGSSPWTEKNILECWILDPELCGEIIAIYIYNIYTKPLVSPPRPTPYRMETSIPFKMPWPTLIL